MPIHVIFCLIVITIASLTGLWVEKIKSLSVRIIVIAWAFILAAVIAGAMLG